MTYFFGGVVVATDKDGTVEYLHVDHLGSPIATTNSSGTVIGTQAFYPFGEVRTSTGSFDTQRGFTGQISDSGTGLNFYNARYQDPALGRFISPDSIMPDATNPSDFNRLSYTRNSPLKFVDPTGNIVWCTCVSIKGQGGNFAGGRGFGWVWDDKGNRGRISFSLQGVGVGFKAGLGPSGKITFEELDTIYDIDGFTQNKTQVCIVLGVGGCGGTTTDEHGTGFNVSPRFGSVGATFQSIDILFELTSVDDPWPPNEIEPPGLYEAVPVPPPGPFVPRLEETPYIPQAPRVQPTPELLPLPPTSPSAHGPPAPWVIAKIKRSLDSINEHW